MIRSSKIPPANFDPIAKPYRWLELLTFGHALQRCRTHFLPHLADRRRALVLGDGDGRFLAALLAANPTLQADAVDTSASMLRQLTRRAQTLTPDTRLRTHQANALDFPSEVVLPQQTYDLVTTHFFVDCLTQPELNSLCLRLIPHLEPNALWLLSDFRIPPRPSLMHWPARALIRSLYLSFRLLTGLRTRSLPDHAAALTAGLTRIAHHHSLAGLLTTELWQLPSKPASSQEYTPSMLPPQRSQPIADPVPDPEPASPSLPGPDPGVFHPQPCDFPPETIPPPISPAE